MGNNANNNQQRALLGDIIVDICKLLWGATEGVNIRLWLVWWLIMSVTCLCWGVCTIMEGVTFGGAGIFACVAIAAIATCRYRWFNRREAARQQHAMHR